MPNEMSQSALDGDFSTRSQPSDGYHNDYEQPGNVPPQSRSAHQDQPQKQHIRSNSFSTPKEYESQSQSRPSLNQGSHFSGDSYGGFLDSYGPHSRQASYEAFGRQGSHSGITPGEEEMPNFDAIEDKSNVSTTVTGKDLHIAPQQGNATWQPELDSARGRPNDRGRPSNFAGQAQRSRSQPSRNNDYHGFDFGTGPQESPMPPMNRQGNSNGSYYGMPSHQQQNVQPSPVLSQRHQTPVNRGINEDYGPSPQGYGHPNQRSDSANPQRIRQDLNHDLRMGPTGQRPMNRPGVADPPPLTMPPRSNAGGTSRGNYSTPSPNSRNGQSPASATRPVNPDALPEHPMPVRPGLMQQSLVSTPISRPPPVRQYNNSSSTGPNISPQPVAQGPPPGSDQPRFVTHEELQRLRQITKDTPHDQKTQLILAKKLVEAVVVLADDNGRADQKTRNKNRERYVMEAHKIVKKLVHNNNVDAMFYLADCYGSGQLGLQKDPKEAFTLYQSAAKLGHAQSAYRVAVCCELGQDEGGGTRRDPLKAIQWYKRAATLGDTPAMYKLGMIMLKGLVGQPRNPREAIGWLKRAAERANEDNPHALHELVRRPPLSIYDAFSSIH